MNKRNMLIAGGILAAAIILVIILIPRDSAVQSSADTKICPPSYGYTRLPKHCVKTIRQPLLYKWMGIGD